MLSISGFFICVSVSLADNSPSTNSTSTSDRKSNYCLLFDYGHLDDNKAYQSEIKEIDRLGRGQDLTGLSQVADKIEQTWGKQSDTRGYFALMDEVTNVLRSHTFELKDIPRQYQLTEKYVQITPTHSNIPLVTTARLLPRFIPEEDLTRSQRPFNTSEWAQLRHTRAPLWLQTRQRIRQLVDPNFDFNRPIFINLPIDLRASTDRKLTQLY